MAWVLWILYFLVVEFEALLSHKPEGTLSDHIWAWFSMCEYGKLWQLRRLILLSFIAWLSAHLLTGGKF